MMKCVAAVAMLLLASGGVIPQKSATGRVAEFENDEVRVWKAIVTPHAPLTMHRHDHPARDCGAGGRRHENRAAIGRQ
jgi:hypothetical protein